MWLTQINRQSFTVSQRGKGGQNEKGALTKAPKFQQRGHMSELMVYVKYIPQINTLLFI